jgi:hypothetical protein
MKQHLALALAVTLLAGCGGGGGGSTSSVPGTSQLKTQGKAGNGSVVISIPVAAPGAQALSRNVRYPQFVSPNALSVALSVNGAADTLFDVSPTSSLCTTVAGLRNCTLAFAAPAGSDTFAFEIFQGANGTGTLLATATSSQTIASGQAFNFTVALNAAIGSLLIMIVPQHGSMNCTAQPNFVTQNVINEGCSGGAPLSIAVEDPSGAPITGTAPYAVPITFTTNDPALTMSPAQITAPGQTETVNYSGAAFGTGITNQLVITATAGSQTSPTTFPIRRSYLYVASANTTPGSPTLPGGGNVAVYQFGASGGTAPVRVFSGTNTGLQTPIKPLVDAVGSIYVLDGGTGSGPSYNGSINVFGTTTSTGTINVAPIRTISNLGSLTSQQCTDMTFDPTGAFLFVACGTEIQVFPTSANGLASSVVATQMQDDNAATHTGLAFDASGDLYISDDSFNAIWIIPAPLPTSGGFHMINGPDSMVPPNSWPAANAPFSLVLDNSGVLYAPIFYLSPIPGGPDTTAELGIWSNGPCVNCAPNATLTGAPFTTHAIGSITLDPPGNAYLANPFTNVITEFSRATLTGASANNPPVLRTLTVAAGASGAFGMTVGP